MKIIFSGVSQRGQLPPPPPASYGPALSIIESGHLTGGGGCDLKIDPKWNSIWVSERIRVKWPMGVLRCYNRAR